MADRDVLRPDGPAMTPPRRSHRRGTEAPSAGYRQRRRAAERSRRRRRNLRRIVMLAASAVIVAALVTAVLLMRGSDGVSGVDSTSTTVPGTAGVYALRVTEGDEAPVVAIIASTDKPTMILALPGQTLIESQRGFEPLDPLLRSEDPGQGFAGIEGLVRRRPVGVVTVTWAEVRKALEAAGVTGDWPVGLAPGRQDAAAAVARALSALSAATAKDQGQAALKAMKVTGDAAGLQASMRALAAGPAVVAALPGKAVEGSDFAYFEPDATGLSRLLGFSSAAAAVSVEVQNGSGVVDIARKVSEALAPLGYTMLPEKNADDFPDVEVTRIYSSPDVVAEADRVRGRLKLGTVVKQESLPPGRIVVVVGRDLKAESLAGTGT